MFPSLTLPRRRIGRRVALGVLSAVFALGALASLAAPEPDTPPSLADALAPSTWAMAVPASWVAASPSGIRAGDRVDVLAMRGGDRAYALPIAFGLRVLSFGTSDLILEVDEEDAIALATARSGGLLLVPILRSTR